MLEKTALLFAPAVKLVTDIPPDQGQAGRNDETFFNSRVTAALL
jgi:hypothetical protein